ncbi:MAG: cbb3-type cytochrome oxidase assembly protein CcoS [Gammaproteobacteria bacterium]|nr:cbb3-type cytochrome oxidase assembly protein CcoS [Gammaproteobacteria bacterium]
MGISLMLIPLALLMLGTAVWAFFWAVNSDQFDNLDNEGRRILEPDQQDPPGDPH